MWRSFELPIGKKGHRLEVIAGQTIIPWLVFLSHDVYVCGYNDMGISDNMNESVGVLGRKKKL